MGETDARTVISFAGARVGGLVTERASVEGVDEAVVPVGAIVGDMVLPALVGEFVMTVGSVVGEGVRGGNEGSIIALVGEPVKGAIVEGSMVGKPVGGRVSSALG